MDCLPRLWPSRAASTSAASDDRPRTRPPDDIRRVLFVGRLDEEKRVQDLLQAVALIPRAVPALAEIVGEGSCRRALEDLTDHLGIRDRVVFHGLVSEEDLLDAYARADLFCMPGIAELQSLATMEAMAAGNPVVAADAMALPHLVKPNNTGRLYPLGRSTPWPITSWNFSMTAVRACRWARPAEPWSPSTTSARPSVPSRVCTCDCGIRSC
ncbi:glycosyltransferase [Streptomyces sp. ISL-98]|uniref:glycosyltransferase n=1 Tax=Streptomyces sp. ISL-98 TaxID=2819192 RepID=UPI001BE92C22|nr:glycosyltransferase [Streptomyces sp. ISL-98]MBT2506539.1 glycosyltransferase [Streptomyces sp. ISL-98]